MSERVCGRHVYWWDGEYDGNCGLPEVDEPEQAPDAGH
jgi:hypothetical protein